MGRILDLISSPSELKKLGIPELRELAGELRSEIISTISKVGGHLASSLGVVELTIALHYVFDMPRDKIIWDVGHQCYAHKLLTGRREVFSSIRQHCGISGFPRKSESDFDSFGTGHASTSISAALGIAVARDLRKEKFDVISVIGDGAMTGGMAFEALNNAGSVNTDLIVVLNDNEMSISRNVGALAGHLAHVRMNPGLLRVRKELRKIVRSIPRIGPDMLKAAEQIEDHLTYLVVPGVIFEALGFAYLGPFDGHNLDQLINVLEKAKHIEGNKLIHVITKKGKGYPPAEKDATKFHGANPFDIDTGDTNGTSKVYTYTEIFGSTLVELARENEKIAAITAAMPDGTGLIDFAREFPARFFDVGIAEQHAVTFAAALASEGFIPFVAIYSTFLQRAFDQIIHDVCLQNLHVVFIVDRAGIVGEDGSTHQGIFDLSYLRMIPNIVIMAPKDENELRSMMKTAIDHNGPVAIRYPRGKAVGVPLDEKVAPLEIGKGEVIREGEDIVLFALGSMVYPSILAAEKLAANGISATVVNARFVKPLDEALLVGIARKMRRVFTVEENVASGGFGTAVAELMQRSGCENVGVSIIGLPDCFIEHASQGILREKLGMTPEGITQSVLGSLQVTL
ncbi:MAG: 1-deoxy-D-xylulose-5-phosphate synthase [Candidatus Eremiobacteraeota bacterium]|nr:1-deoxy-D-xylulose-5-phosphate synthase [Candidatus Eremiobacteraeota bacterium]